MHVTYRLGGLLLGCAIFCNLAGQAHAQLKLTADLQDKINEAIDKGAKALLKLQRSDGTYERAGGQNGLTALAALTLLECGVDRNDPRIQLAAKFVRESAINESMNYSVSLAIMFLDRFGDPQDVPIIQALGLRLLESQNKFGGWSYFSGAVSGAENTWLKGIIANRNPNIKPIDPDSKPFVYIPTANLPAMLKGRAIALANRKQFEEGGGDNSNTQFCMIAVWISGKYGVPVRLSMTGVQWRFENTQQKDGSWVYIPHFPGQINMGGHTTPAMTCAGLLGLALGHANEVQAQNAGKPVPVGIKKEARVFNWAANKRALAAFDFLDKAMMNPAIWKDPANVKNKAYILWSMERVGVLYNVEAFATGSQEWYPWAASELIAVQGADGLWPGEYGSTGADTCFALLVLGKINLLRDFTESNTGKKPPKTAPVIKPGLLDLVPLGVKDVPKKKDGTFHRVLPFQLERDLLPPRLQRWSLPEPAVRSAMLSAPRSRA